MAINENGQRVTLYQKDYSPVELYADGRKVAGFTTQELSGCEVSAEGTYRDVLDLTLNGRHEQKQHMGKNLWNISDVANNFEVVMHQLGSRSTYYATPTAFKYVPLIDSSAVSKDTAFNILSRVPVQMTENVEYSITFDYERKNCTGDRLQCGRGNNYMCNIRDVSGSITPFRVTPLLGNSNEYSKGRAIGTVVAPNSGAFYIQLGIDSPDFIIADSANGEESFLMLKDFMVTEGYAAGDIPAYEPYVGGMPSPNPQYPQEIVSLEGENVYIRSTNYCPSVGNWNLAYGAYFDDQGYIALPDSSSRASIQIPWKTDGFYLEIHIDAQALTENESTYLVNTKYLHADMAYIIGNGKAEVITQESQRYSATFGDCYKSSLYAAAIHDVELSRSGLYGKYPYRFKHVSIADIASVAENKEYLLGDMPQYLAWQHRLYGADGVYDTIEPCVKVNGEWKCRVIRRWKKYVFNGSENIIYAGMIGRFYPSYATPPGDVIAKLPTDNQKRYIWCDKLTGYTWNEANELQAGFWGVSARQDGPCTYIRLFLGEMDNLETAKQWLADNKPTIVFPLAEPDVELYEPMMLRTHPFTTIIKGNTELKARIKTIDTSI